MMNDAVSVCAAARMKGKLKRRWPLNRAIICVEQGEREKMELLSDLLHTQLNVHTCDIIELEHHTGLAELLEMKKAGISFYSLSDDELAEWKSVSGAQLPAWDEIKKKLVGSLATFEKLVDAANTPSGYFVHDVQRNGQAGVRIVKAKKR